MEQLETRQLLASDMALVLESDLLAGKQLPTYPHVDQTVVEAYAAFDARRSEVPKVETAWLGLEDLNILGTPNLMFKHDGELLLNVSFSPGDQSFRTRIASTGVEIYSESDPPGAMYIWASFSQLDSVSQLNGLKNIQTQRRADNDSGGANFTAAAAAPAALPARFLGRELVSGMDLEGSSKVQADVYKVLAVLGKISVLDNSRMQKPFATLEDLGAFDFPSAQVRGDGTVLVNISYDQRSSFRSEMVGLGITPYSESEQGGDLYAWLSAGQLGQVSSLAGLQSVQLQQRAIADTYTSQGYTALKADVVSSRFSAYGIDGSGVKIGVISDGVTNLTTAISQGELSSVTVEPSHSGVGDEGTAMLEIIHDLAPGASLYFAEGSTGPIQFSNAIQWMLNNGVNVIVDDMNYVFDSAQPEPFFQDGAMADKVAFALASGVTYVGSAGNYNVPSSNGIQHYQWQATINPSTLRHDFDPTAGVDDALDVIVPAGKTIEVVLQWSDDWSNSTSDYNLYLDNTSDVNLIKSEIVQSGGGSHPWEELTYANNSGSQQTYRVRAKAVSNTVPSRELELFVRNAIINQPTYGATTAVDAIVQQRAADGLITVAAERAGTTMVADYSSRGPSTIYTSPNTNQNKILRNSLDITATSNVSTLASASGWSPFLPISQGGSGLFDGTSAASPHAAAIVGLMRDASNNGLSVATYTSLLDATAADITPSGYDQTSGYGLANALDAVYASFTPEAPTLLYTTDNGRFINDGVTSITSQTIRTLVPADSFIQLYRDGSPFMSFPNTGGATAHDFSFTATQNTANTYTIKVKSSSSAPDAGYSNSSGVLTVYTDALANFDPTTQSNTTPVMTAATDLGQSQTDGITTITTPGFYGTMPAGSISGAHVTLLGDGSYRGDASWTSGTYLVSSSALAYGSRTMKTVFRNLAGAPYTSYYQSLATTATIDDGSPAVAPITQVSGTQASPVYTSPGAVTITFNKPVYSFTKNDLLLYRRDLGSVTSAASATQFNAAQFSGVSPLPPLSPNNGYYNGMVLRFTSGALAGQSKTVQNYVGTTGTFTFATGFSATPSAGDVFVVDAPVNGSVATPTSASQFNGAAPLATADNWYNTKTLRFTTGALSGQSRVISGYIGSTRTFTFGTAFSQAPSVGDKFLIDGPVNRLVSPSGANVTSSNGTTWSLTPAFDITMTTGQYALSLISGNGILNVAGGSAHPTATGPMEWWQNDKQYQNGGLTDGPNNLPGLYYDVTRDGFIVSGDSLTVINSINAWGSGTMPRPGMNCNSPNFCYQDVSADGFLAPNDALEVINYINAGYSSQPQGFAPGGGGGGIPPGDLQPSDVTANVVLQTVDLDGDPITSIKAGQKFQLQAFLVLAAPVGVQPFAGFADVAYPSSLVAAARSSSDVGLVGSTAGRGLIDEAGRVMYLDAAGLMFSQTFTATKKGTATFASDAADLFGHEIYVTGLNDALPWSQVTFGSTTLTIR